MTYRIHVAKGFPFEPLPCLALTKLTDQWIFLEFAEMQYTGFERLTGLVLDFEDLRLVGMGVKYSLPHEGGIITFRPGESWIDLSFMTATHYGHVQLRLEEWKEACKGLAAGEGMHSKANELPDGMA